MQIQNSKFKNLINQQPTTNNQQLNFGFTLVELLVVVALVSIIGTITTQVFVLGFRSQTKAEVLKEVKQSGDFAIAVIESMVRNAADIPLDQSSCNTNMSKLTILNQDGLTTTFDCTGTSIASVSGFFVPAAQPTPTGVPLIGSKVTVTNCNFRVVCPDPPLSPKYVYVSFTLNQATGALVTPIPENRASLDYQTTISLRNYQ